MISITVYLASAGFDSGPFSLLTSPDGINFAPFKTGVDKTALLEGGIIYTDAPNGTAYVRIISTSALCTNYIDVILSNQYTFNWQFSNGPQIAPQIIYKITLNGSTMVDLVGYITSQSGSFFFNKEDTIVIETTLTADADFYNGSELGLDIADNLGYDPAIYSYLNEAPITNSGNATKYNSYTKLPAEIWNFNVWSKFTAVAFQI